jgi:MoxR-like ATPase
VWVDGALVQAMEQGKVLLIDEIGLIDPKVLSIVYSVMDGRGELTVTQNPDRGTVKAKDGFFVIGATNPNAIGVQLSEALLSRFTIQVEVNSDYELAEHLGVNKKLVNASRLLDRQRQNGTVMWSPQLRELFAFQRNEKIFGLNFSARSLIAGAPEIDRDNVADVVSKALGTTLSPLRMEG